MMLLDLSRHTLRRGWAPYAGSFVALLLGVALIGLTVELITAVNDYGSTLGPGAADQRMQLDNLASMLGVMSGFSGFIAIFVVASTFAFVVTSRRRELGLLRLVGATPRQVRRMILGESVILATVASLAGCVLAHALTPLALWLIHERGVTPLRLGTPSFWPTLAIAFPIGVLVALLGARTASRRASRIPPVDAMRESAVDGARLGLGRLMLGAALLAGLVAMFVTIGSVSGELSLVLAIFLPEVLVVTMVCFGPVVFPLLARLVALPMLASHSVTLRMARDNVAASAKRTASLAAPTLAISAIAGSLIVTLGVAADFDRAVNQQKLKAPVVVTAGDDGGVAAARVLEHSPYVRLADSGRPVNLTLLGAGGRDREQAEAISPERAAAARGLRAREGSLEKLHGNAIALSRTFMSDSGRHLGQRIRVSVAGHEPVLLRLVAVVDDAPSLYGDLLVPATLAGVTTGADRWFVLPEPGVEDPVAAIRSELKGTGAVAESSAAWIARTDAALRKQNTLALWVLLGPGGFYAGLSIANTLLMGSLQRHREFVATRLIGATGRQVRRMVLWESAIVTAAALTVGTATTAAVGLFIRHGLSDGQGGFPIDVPWQSLGVIASTCLVVAAVASLAPTALVLRRVHPSQAVE